MISVNMIVKRLQMITRCVLPRLFTNDTHVFTILLTNAVFYFIVKHYIIIEAFHIEHYELTG